MINSDIFVSLKWLQNYYCIPVGLRNPTITISHNTDMISKKTYFYMSGHHTVKTKKHFQIIAYSIYHKYLDRKA